MELQRVPKPQELEAAVQNPMLSVIELFPQFCEAADIVPFTSLGKGKKDSQNIPHHFYQIWHFASHIS